MDINEFYDVAKSYASRIREVKPEYCNDVSSTITLIITDASEIVSGVTSVKVSNDAVVALPSECVAVANMLEADKTRAKQLITVSLLDESIVSPCTDCLVRLYKLNDSNGGCEIITANNEIKFISDLIDMSATDEPVAAAESLGSPADFSDGFDFDDSNPFFDSNDSSNDEEEVPTLSYANDDPTAEGGYPQQPGYPPPGYPPMQGYPMQGYPQGAFGYPMAGYPQPGYPQQGYPMQPVYPQGAFGGQPVYPQGAFGGQPVYPQGAFGGQPVGYPQPNANGQSQYIQPDGSVAPAGESINASNASEAASQYLSKGNNVFKKRLNNFLGDDQDNSFMTDSQGKPLSNEELKKLAKEKKKAAKMGGNMPR